MSVWSDLVTSGVVTFGLAFAGTMAWLVARSKTAPRPAPRPAPQRAARSRRERDDAGI